MEDGCICLRAATFRGDDWLRERSNIRVAIHVGSQGDDVQRLTVGKTVHVHVGEKVKGALTGVEVSTECCAAHVAIAEINLLVSCSYTELAQVNQAAGADVNHWSGLQVCRCWFARLHLVRLGEGAAAFGETLRGLEIHQYFALGAGNALILVVLDLGTVDVVGMISGAVVDQHLSVMESPFAVAEGTLCLRADGKDLAALHRLRVCHAV